MEGSASAGSQAGPGSGPAGHAAHQGGEGLPPKLRWAVWPSASGGARPLPSQPVSCLQTGLRWDPAEHPGVHGYLVRDPGPAFPPTHTPWVTLDKLWNLSETADTPMRWPGLLGKGAAVPEAQQPGHSGAGGKARALWEDGSCRSSGWEGHVPCLLPPGPLSPLHVGGAAAGTQEVLRKHPPALSSCSLHPTGQTPSHVSSQVSLPQETPPPTRTAQDLAWCKGSQAVPLPAPAQRPGSLYTHTCPCASPAHQAGGRAVCLAPSSGLTPGGPQQAFLEETRPFPLGWVLHPCAHVGLPPANGL